MAAAKPSYWVGKAIQAIRVGLVRDDATFTQEHVAHESGTSLRHYQKIEAGAIDVRISTLFAIAAVLGMKPQKILEWADDLARTKRR